MRLAVGVLAALMLLPSGVAAQEEPMRVCTQLTVREDHELAGSPLLRGEPPDGDCDVEVFLPIIVADSLMVAAISQAAREEAERQAEAERLAAMTCGELDELRESDVAAEYDYLDRCATCEELDELRQKGPIGSGVLAEFHYFGRCATCEELDELRQDSGIADLEYMSRCEDS